MKTEKNVIAPGGYKAPEPPLMPYYAGDDGGLLEETGTSPWTLFPMRFGDGSQFNPDTLVPTLANITLAAEYGMLTRHNWPQQLFADKLSFDVFIEALREYPGRIYDRVWYALCVITGLNELGYVVLDDVATAIGMVALRDGCLDEPW